MTSQHDWRDLGDLSPSALQALLIPEARPGEGTYCRVSATGPGDAGNCRAAAVPPGSAGNCRVATVR